MSRKFGNKLILPALLSLMFAAPASQAAINLIAIGSISGSINDLAGQNTGTNANGTLENGVSGNLFGGIGSGLAWAGGTTFIATPDRGPNAVSYNNGVADTTSYINRFQTLTLDLSVNSGNLSNGFTTNPLSYVLSPTLTNTTLLSSTTPLIYGTGTSYGLGSGAPSLNATNNTNYFTGRSDNFGGTLSTNPNNGRLDPEGVRVSHDGRSIYVSDEYGPYIYQFDMATGQRIHTFTPPSNLAVAVQGPTTASEGSPTNTTGRVGNKGMEGLAISPDGKTLFGVMQAPLLQDVSKSVRIVKINIDPTSAHYGDTNEYAYKLTDGSGISEMVAINDHEFLLDERDGNGLGDVNGSGVASTAVTKKIYKIDLNGATDISSTTITTATQLTTVAVAKTQFLDIVAALTSLGISANDIPAKLEGLAFGQDIVVGGQTRHTLYVANDNDFIPVVTDSNNHPLGKANPNNFYVFSFTDADLGGSTFVPQDISTVSAVPLPGALLLMLSGLTGFGVFGKRRKSA